MALPYVNSGSSSKVRVTPRGALRETIVTIPDIEEKDGEVQFCPPHRVKHELQTLLDLYNVRGTLI